MQIKKNKTYLNFLEDIKKRVTSAKIASAKTINRSLLELYWDIGKMIVEKQKEEGWGKSVVERLSQDLQKEYPGGAGFSSRNLWDMKRFYEQYADNEKLRQLVAEIPWSHNLLIMSKISDFNARSYYIEATRHLGWSRNVLLNQIKSEAYERALIEKKTHNFDETLPDFLAEQADETFKSSYNLDFLGIGKPLKERELEKHLIARLKDFILELGYGFCFIGNQYKLILGHNEYFLDLLFYHRFLKSLVVVELKVGKFRPEYAGKMDFYLNLLNDNEKAPDDNPSIGIILCAEKDSLEVEYSIQTKQKPYWCGGI
jgi:predicted nuclease of restriction endonuclease-like (RecB) superfamily